MRAHVPSMTAIIGVVITAVHSIENPVDAPVIE